MKLRSVRAELLQAALWILGAVVFGSLWQIEITILNQLNGDYPFAYLFTWIQGVNNWAARDFFFALIGVSFFLTVAVAYKLGKASATTRID